MPHGPHRAALILILAAAFSLTAAPADPVAPWRTGVRIAPVTAVTNRHSIHSYYLANPESPDGTKVLFFASQHPASHIGEIRVLNRQTGHEILLADNVHTEDAHRVACQQWISGGTRVAYHEVVNKRWRVVVIDLATRAKQIIAEDRQIGFARPDSDLVLMYGCHWNPGPYRDLYAWDARTGETRVALKMTAVEAQHGEWLRTEFAGKPASIFFPVLSPDLQRVFFKLAAGNGGDDFMSKGASQRQGTVCFDLASSRLKWFRGKWGHPAWHPDSRRIFEMGNLIFDTDQPATNYARLKDVPYLRGSHPSVSPDGRLMVTDGLSDAAGGKPGEWGILVGDMQGERSALLFSFDQSKGANSWRRNHPHPAFSADGKRIYFNVSDGPFTRLHVAESATR